MKPKKSKNQKGKLNFGKKNNISSFIHRNITKSNQDVCPSDSSKDYAFLNKVLYKDQQETSSPNVLSGNHSEKSPVDSFEDEIIGNILEETDLPNVCIPSLINDLKVAIQQTREKEREDVLKKIDDITNIDSKGHPYIDFRDLEELKKELGK